MKLILFITLLLYLSINFFNKYIKNKKTLLLITNLLFGNVTCTLNLEKYDNFDSYLKSLKSKKRRELNKIINNEFNNIQIKKSNFKLEFINLLYQFLQKKYQSKPKELFYLVLSILLFLTNKLNFWTYYKKDKLLGWSSYLIYKDTYYDFISSPNNINLSVIGINSIKYCIANKIKLIDMGPTNIKLKIQKFNAEIEEK